MGDVALKIEYKNTHPPIFLSTKLINPTEPSSFNPMRRLASFLCLCLLVVLPVFPANTVEAAQNSASVTVGGSFGSGGFKPSGSAGIGSDEGHASSTTEAGISGIAGKEDVRTGDTETGLQNNFDKDKVQKEIDAQIAITQSFGQQASKAWGDYANTKLLEAIASGTASDVACWAPDGACRAAGHVLVGGLGGGVSGAIGAGASSVLTPYVQEFLINQGLSPAAAAALIQLSILEAGQASGNTAAGAGAFNEATNNALVIPIYAVAAGMLAACEVTPACKKSLDEGSRAIINAIILTAESTKDGLIAAKEKLASLFAGLMPPGKGDNLETLPIAPPQTLLPPSEKPKENEVTHTGNNSPPVTTPGGNTTGGDQIVDTKPGDGFLVNPARPNQEPNIIMEVSAKDREALYYAFSGVMGGAAELDRTTKGNTEILIYPNGTQADADNVFDSLPLTNIETKIGNLGSVRVGKLPDGTSVIIRPSKDGRPTIQITDATNKRTVQEYRFGSK